MCEHTDIALANALGHTETLSMQGLASVMLLILL